MIPLNDFRRQWEDTGQSVLDATAAVGESGWYILGQHVKCFEAALAEACGVRYAVGVASGLDAIEIALRAAGCRRGDKVLTTPLSAFATTLAIVKLGAIPVFVDTDAHGLIDLDECRRVLSERPDIRFLVPVHLYGHALNLRDLARLRDEYGCTIVEDCAQSIMACFGGVRSGTVGRLSATSFYPTKNLGAMGDAGAILTDREEDYQLCRALRDYGQSGKYQHDFIGYNSRMDELHAAILQRAFLPKLGCWTDQRRRIAQIYLEGIRHPRLQPLGQPEGSDSVWHLFPLSVHGGRKTELRDYLAGRGITSGEHYPTLIPRQRALASVEYEVIGDCATAAALAASELSIPIHPYLSDAEVGQVIDACNGWEG